MPNIQSAKKRVKVISTKTAMNKSYKSELKTAIKNAIVDINANSENKIKSVRLAIKKIDQAASKGIIHKNTASRKKSALSIKLNSTSV